MEVRVPVSVLGPSGSNIDIADKLANWLRQGANVPHGASVTNRTRVILPPGVFRHEGGSAGAVHLDKWQNVILEGDNTQFVQRSRRPFVVIADSSNVSLDPVGKWNIWYTPTNILTIGYVGTVAGHSAFDRATDKCWTLNRARSFFRLRKCVLTSIGEGIRMTGCAGLDPVFNKNYEAQFGVGFYGCVECELGNGVIEQTLGNAVEGNRFNETDGSYTATSKLWVHGMNMHHFGRQVASLTYGGKYILERNDMGNTGRSLIDMEPTTNRNPDGQGATVEGIYVLNNTIGTHTLGMIAAGETHGDVRWIRVAGNKGRGIGTSGRCVASGVIFEDNVDTDNDQSPEMCRFGSGVLWGGDNYIVRRNVNYDISETGVRFDGANGGCTNYLVIDNNFRRDGATSRVMPQFRDYAVPPWAGTFKPFALPTPSHRLRDL